MHNIPQISFTSLSTRYVRINCIAFFLASEKKILNTFVVRGRGKLLKMSFCIVDIIIIFNRSLLGPLAQCQYS